MEIALDVLDQKAAEAFEGFVVRKDLALKFKGQYPVPTYVGEFLIGRYCASTDPEEIAEGLRIVETQLKNRTARAGEAELFKSRAREDGTGQDDRPRQRPPRRQDRFLPGDAPQPAARRRAHRRPISSTSTSACSPAASTPSSASSTTSRSPRRRTAAPFGITGLRPIQLSRRDVSSIIIEGRRRVQRPRSGRTSSSAASGWSRRRSRPRAQDAMLLRMVPFVERNYNLIELGPRGTGKSPPLPAGLALLPPRLRRQSDRRPHVRQHGHRAARPGRPHTTSSASTRSPASPSTRRTASTS